jgi:hypothetical protein
LGVLSCVWGSFGRLLVSFPPSGPSLGPGRLRPLCGAMGGLRFFPFLAWSGIPPSSADFGTCPGNHLASIFQVYSFAVIQWGLLLLLGESAPAPEVAGWTTVNIHVAIHLLEMRPVQVCPEQWVADSLQSPASPPSFLQVSGITSGGFPCAKPRRGYCQPSRSLWSWCLFQVAFLSQRLSFNQEAFQVFRPES